MVTRKAIVQKTKQFSIFTLLSRCLGIIREMLMIEYLGISMDSDAFLTAFRIPNMLRKTFAEGALSAIFVPTIIQTMRTSGKKSVGQLMTFGFVAFEGFLVCLTALIIWQADWVISLFAPGFPVEQIAKAISFLKILMPFILFISSSALLAGALQAVDHFFIVAFAPVLLNLVFISALLICNYFALPVTVLCWFILFGGFIQFFAHLIIYLKLNFSFDGIRIEDVRRFTHVVVKFLPCFISMSVMEIGLIIDQRFASYLGVGSISLINYGNRFMGIPLGVFAAALSTILLPHFSRVALAAPGRLKLYVLEAAKLVFWVMIPISVLMFFFAEKIFLTLFLSQKFTMVHVVQAAYILRAFLFGLFFFAINKILLSMYYAKNSVWVPASITMISVVCNAILNSILINIWGLTGLALATSFAEIIRTALFVIILMKLMHISFDFRRFSIFALHYLIQIIIVGIPFTILYYALDWLFAGLPMTFAYFFLENIGLWIWVGPLSLAFFYVLWWSRTHFKVKLYFLEQ
ncbi:MAG TPA: murein biosynthesis integral membrane protein MurJ [Candidatus Dependentiae bacterium]|nr:murein biosynthesis integral membrane protein MurJ [Candidatus Dependentiae bacterium]HRQ63028.1 murein biosynthesis integral membrane protein MurJ [Candidatus Dependentiae bacterium]